MYPNDDDDNEAVYDDDDDDDLQDVVLCQLINPSEDEGELSNGLQSWFVSPLQTDRYSEYYYNIYKCNMTVHSSNNNNNITITTKHRKKILLNIEIPAT